ncbi:aminotransferase class IV [Hymenobacter actinosclerus]|uniref:Branched-chain amino acid aminotransferase n=1 Tax=Hymenobacter actinosclerus TaxID=82805 RepID=A0A1I0DQ42_9BACT|nr:aminotransferase class IV [Hymenobacter actinosclerus]SET34666.1 branched-chain amino acid aminotransferase [Hymenobacter actinosclerus]
MLLCNNQLHPESTFALPLPNRGLQFNDGFFETLVWADGGLRYGPQHLARMQRAAAALDLPLPAALATLEALTATLARLVGAQPQPAAPQRLRLQLWRPGGGLYAPPEATGQAITAEWLVTARPFEERTAPVALAGFGTTVRTQLSPVSFCKGPNALLYVLAAREREQRGLDELLLLSGAGHVAEAGAAAVGWVRKDAVYVPAETAGGVSSVRLAHLRAVATQLGVVWHEGLYEPDALLAAEAVFTASVAGLRPVQQVEGRRFDSAQHPLLLRLLAADLATRS